MIIRRNTAGSLAFSDAGATTFGRSDGDVHTQNKLLIRMRFWKGEWKFDTRLGIPFKQEILGRKVPSSVLHGIFWEALSITNGVLRVVRVDVSQDSTTRTASVGWECILTDGTTVTQTPFIIGEAQ